MVRNAIGALLTLIAAGAAIWSTFLSWFNGREGQSYGLSSLLSSDGIVASDSAIMIGLFLPMAVAALIAVIGLVLRSQITVIVAGLLILGFTILWLIRQGQNAGSLTVGGDTRLDWGSGIALGSGLLMLISAAVMGGRKRRRGRHRDAVEARGAGARRGRERERERDRELAGEPGPAAGTAAAGGAAGGAAAGGAAAGAQPGADGRPAGAGAPSAGAPGAGAGAPGAPVGGEPGGTRRPPTEPVRPAGTGPPPERREPAGAGAGPTRGTEPTAEKGPDALSRERERRDAEAAQAEHAEHKEPLGQRIRHRFQRGGGPGNRDAA